METYDWQFDNKYYGASGRIGLGVDYDRWCSGKSKC